MWDVLFPKRCVGCQTIGQYICNACREQVKVFGFSICPVCDRPSERGRTHEVCLTPDSLDGFIPIAQYAEPVSLLVKKIKYARVYDAAEEVFRLFKYNWPSYAPTFDLLIPMPVHPSRLHERGFNQAEIFARGLGNQLGVPMETRALRKVKKTVAQASLRLKERKNNLEQGFACLRPELVKDKVIGLVDDVATTRTTVKTAGSVLKHAGAKEVWAVVLAHRF